MPKDLIHCLRVQKHHFTLLLFRKDVRLWSEGVRFQTVYQVNNF